MQATTCFHDSVPHAILQEADFVLHDPVAFHPANRMFDPDTDGRDPPIHGFLRGGEFPSPRCFLGWDDGDPRQAESLEALILIQATARGQGLPRFLGQALIRRVACTRMAQAAHVTGLRDHEEVFERVARLLATVILVLFFGIFRAVDRTFSAIMPTRGVVDLPSVVCGATITVNSAAVRAGSSS